MPYTLVFVRVAGIVTICLEQVILNKEIGKCILCLRVYLVKISRCSIDIIPRREIKYNELDAIQNEIQQSPMPTQKYSKNLTAFASALAVRQFVRYKQCAAVSLNTLEL